MCRAETRDAFATVVFALGTFGRCCKRSDYPGLLQHFVVEEWWLGYDFLVAGVFRRMGGTGRFGGGQGERSWFPSLVLTRVR